MANIPSNQASQARNLLENAKSVLIAVHANPTVDSIAASLSLYLALSSVGKQATVICPTSMTVEFNQLVGVDKVVGSVSGGSGRNLIISFPYQEGSIEKVSYNIENDTFNLVIEPREGYPQVTPENIRYSNGGGTTDLVITINSPRLTDLGRTYQDNQNLFRDKPLINIDYASHNARYGKVNLVDPSVSCTSELVVSLLSQLGFTIDADTASNLLTGISAGSANFSSETTSASTFEAAAICLKSGARKSIQMAAPIQYGSDAFAPMGQQQPVSIPFPNPPKASFPRPQAGSFSNSNIQSQPIMGKPQTGKQKTASPTHQPPRESTHPETPPDWLKPKIYKGSTLL